MNSDPWMFCPTASALSGHPLGVLCTPPDLPFESSSHVVPLYNCDGHGWNFVNAPECQCTVWLDRYTKPSYWSLEPLLFGTATGKSAGCSEPPFYMVVSGAFGPAFGLRFNTNRSAHLLGAMTNGAYVKYKVACTSISIQSRWTGRSVFDETPPPSSSRFD